MKNRTQSNTFPTQEHWKIYKERMTTHHLAYLLLVKSVVDIMLDKVRVKQFVNLIAIIFVASCEINRLAGKKNCSASTPSHVSPRNVRDVIA